jgi:hypothetical protein
MNSMNSRRNSKQEAYDSHGDSSDDEDLCAQCDENPRDGQELL